MQQNRRARAC